VHDLPRIVVRAIVVARGEAHIPTRRGAPTSADDKWPRRGLAGPSASAPFLEMAGRKMRADEIAAAEIVAAYLDGNPEARDVEGAPDKHTTSMSY